MRRGLLALTAAVTIALGGAALGVDPPLPTTADLTRAQALIKVGADQGGR